MKLYDLILELLTKHQVLRNSDKKLMWSIWYRLDYIVDGNLSKEAFTSEACPTPESITRCRRKIQEEHPELQADDPIEKARRAKADEKGTFIYREEVAKPKPEPDRGVGHWEYEGSVAKWVESKQL